MIPNQLIADRVFLALVVWREARGESPEARAAVACSILARVAKPRWWGHDVASVIFARLQYSSMTFPHDPQLTAWPRADDISWQACLQLACDAIDGKVTNPAPGADSYYDGSIPPPSWAKTSLLVASIGRIRFFDTDKPPQAPAG